MKLKMILVLSITFIALLVVPLARGAQTSGSPITADNAANVKQLALLQGHTGPVFTLAFSPDSKTLLSGGSGSDYTARLWDVTSAGQKALLEGHSGQIAAVAFNADGTQAETASYDRTIRLWDAATGAAGDIIDKTSDESLLFISNLYTYFNSDGTKLIYASDGGGGVYVFDLTSREQTIIGGVGTDLSPLFGNQGTIRLSQDGKMLAVEEINGGPIHLIDMEAGTEIKTLARPDANSYGFTALAISPDGKTIAAVDDTSSVIQLWNVETGEPGPALTGHTPNDQGTLGVYGLAFSPDSTLLASASYDKTVRLWDVAEGKQLVSLASSSDQGAGVVAWSPDGALLASANLDGSIQVWSAQG